MANVLTDTAQFAEKASSVSVNNRFQRSDLFEYKGKKYRVIDNIGFNDTNKLTIADVLREIGKGIYSAENRINQILFVISGKFNKEQVKAFNLFKDFISETGITKFNTIVRTNFSNFKDSQKCKEDEESLLAENEEIREMIESCNGIIHIDNPPIPVIKEGIDDEEREELEDEKKVHERKRKESREKVLTHLVEKCSEVYKLKEWENIYGQIEKCVRIMDEKRKKIDEASDSERIKLQSELETEEKKFAQQINVALGVKVGSKIELIAQVELRDIKWCCSVS